MVQLDSAKPGGLEKFIRWAFLGAMIWGGIKLFNYAAPTVIQLMKNMYWLIGLGVPLAFIVLYVISNPFLIWTQYKKLCRSITSFFIKLDPLSIMKGYLEYLQKKKENLDKVKLNLEGRRTGLKRKINDLQTSITTNRQYGQAALKSSNNKQAQAYGNYIAGDTESLKTYTALFDQLDQNCKFLSELSENWGYAIEGLSRNISRKEEEYLTLRDTVRALKQAKEFAQATEAQKLFDESLKELEKQTSQSLAYIEDFEEKSKPVMDNINLEKKVRAEQGMAALQNLNDSKFMLPTNFTDKLPSQEIQYETVKSKYGL